MGRPPWGAGPCSCFVALWGAKSSPLPPRPHGPSPPHPPASAEWTLTAGTSPRPRIHLPMGPEAEPGTPFPAALLCHPGHGPGAPSPPLPAQRPQPAQTDPSRSALCGQQRHCPLTRGASPEAGSTALSAGGRGSCSTHSGSPKLRLGPGAGSGRLSPFRGSSGCSPPRLQTLTPATALLMRSPQNLCF